MAQRWCLLAAFMVLVLVVLGGCSQDKGEAGMANPASVYCEEQGGELEIRSNDAGEYGVCKFDDGSECEEWQFYRGECSPGMYQRAEDGMS